MNTYTLMNKNTELLDVTMERGFPTAITNIRKDKTHLLPVFMFSKDMRNPNIVFFGMWWRSRQIPASRVNINDILHYLTGKVICTDELAEKSFGLSLSDHYWLRISPEITWEQVNFFTNTFSEDIGDLVLDGKVKPAYDFMSPDNTSDGIIPKRWKIIQDKRVLIKGSFSGVVLQPQPFREVFASRVANILLNSKQDDFLKAVNYSVGIIDDRAFSYCENFVTTETEYVPFHQIVNSDGFFRIEGQSSFEFVESFYKADKFQFMLHGMLLLDYIVLNQDRHFGNFGLIRCVDTGEFLYPAPIFDTGNSVFYNSNKLRVHDLYSKPFSESFEEQLNLINIQDFSEELKMLEPQLHDIFWDSFKNSFEQESLFAEWCYFRKTRRRTAFHVQFWGSQLPKSSENQ